MSLIYPDHFKILVTGGSGFIGYHLVNKLLNNTKATVYNLDKISYASNNFRLDNLYSDNKRYHFLKINLENKENTYKAIEEANPDIIFHLAAESHVDNSINNPSPFIMSNIVGTFNLLEAARKHFKNLPNERKKHFIFQHISTDEVFGSLGLNGSFSESTNYDPRSPYSASKAASDHLVRSWHHTYNFPILITNCSNNFGPGQFEEKLIPKAIKNALANKSIPLYGEGTNIRDWLYVEDHIDALLSVSKFGRIGQSYCIGGNGEKNNKEVLNLICNLLDELVPKNETYSNLITHVKDRPGHDFRYSINASKIKNDIGWEPQYSFLDSLRKTVKWYVDDYFKK